VLLAVDPDEHLIKVSGVAWPRPTPAQLVGEAPAELETPTADALVGDDHAPFGQQQLDISQAQAEHEVEPDRMGDDLVREAVATASHLGSLAQLGYSGQRPLT